MARPWIVPQHGPIERLESNLWSVAGAVEKVPLRRRMTVVRLTDGRLVIWSCMPLAQPEMQELEAWGTPSFIIVPNAHHRLDAPAYKARYPHAKVLCASEIRQRVAQVVDVDGGIEELPADATLLCERVPGTDGGECALRVLSDNGHVSVVLNDVAFNHPHVPGFVGFLLKALGSTGGPRLTLVARLLVVKNKRALRAYLFGLSEIGGLARVVVSHVDVIDRDPASVLAQIASSLS